VIHRDVSRMATFACSHCLTQRPYGFGHDVDSGNTFINCATCQIPTRHTYVENNDYEVLADMRPDKVVSITFTRASRA
jgi:hypothetical protein